MLPLTSPSREAPLRRYYVKDHLGSVRTVVDASGAVKETRDDDPVRAAHARQKHYGGDAGAGGHTGHEQDTETGLYYAGARYSMSAYVSV